MIPLVCWVEIAALPTVVGTRPRRALAGGASAKHNGNIAIFEYIDDLGNRIIKEFSTITQKDWRELGYLRNPHAERLGLDWLAKNNIKLSRVISVYSELEPCSFILHKCKMLLEKSLPMAKIEFSYKYSGIFGDNLQVARKASIEERIKDLNELIP